MTGGVLAITIILAICITILVALKMLLEAYKVTAKRDQLQEVVDTLEEVHYKVKADLERMNPGGDPYQMVSSDGRYVLLDSLTQIVNAKTVLANGATKSIE